MLVGDVLRLGMGMRYCRAAASTHVSDAWQVSVWMMRFLPEVRVVVRRDDKKKAWLGIGPTSASCIGAAAFLAASRALPWTGLYTCTDHIRRGGGRVQSVVCLLAAVTLQFGFRLFWCSKRRGGKKVTDAVEVAVRGRVGVADSRGQGLRCSMGASDATQLCGVEGAQRVPVQ